jgi:hypothetical protein
LSLKLGISSGLFEAVFLFELELRVIEGEFVIASLHNAGLFAFNGVRLFYDFGVCHMDDVFGRAGGWRFIDGEISTSFKFLNKLTGLFFIKSIDIAQIGDFVMFSL